MSIVQSSALGRLFDASHGSLSDSLWMARRLISARSGIVRALHFEDLHPDEPPVFWARSVPAKSAHVLHQPALALGNGASVDPQRAMMKALGETIERYCSAWCDYDGLIKEARRNLSQEAIDLRRLALFSDAQYRSEGFPFHDPDDDTTIAWVRALSMQDGRSVLVPATLVYVPYDYRVVGDTPIHHPISTGMACGANWTSAGYKGLLEAIERDHFMIAWHNGLHLPQIDLTRIEDPLICAHISALSNGHMDCKSYDLTMDIGVPVVLTVIRSITGSPPLAVVGLGSDLSPARALLLSLEEAAQGVIGMHRLSMANAVMPEPFVPSADYKNVNSLNAHGLSYAIDSFLAGLLLSNEAPLEIRLLSKMPDRSTGGAGEDLRKLVELLASRELEVLLVDLTTRDIADIGFRVVRAVVPGLQPLDVDHSMPYLGGTRLYDVPRLLGHIKTSCRPPCPYPHPFP